MNVKKKNKTKIIFTDGSSYKLKGSILTMSFLDCNGALVPYSYESWKDENSDSKDRSRTLKNLYSSLERS